MSSAVNPISRSPGITPSERYLAKLAEDTFLNLWSYPTPFRDQRKSPSAEGKELCDLLVVCDRYIIVFSVKTINWTSGPLAVSWARWARRAIQHSAKQANGAVRWITEFPARIFLDRECNNPFPIPLPGTEERVVQRVVVANGAANICRSHVFNSSGSLKIDPNIQGAAHWESRSRPAKPFTVGDIDPGRPFVHVFDEVSLDIVMSELDTIRDLTDYLDKRANFIRSGLLKSAHGEEHLLAYYAVRMNDDGEHDFVAPEASSSNPTTIDHTHFPRLRRNPRYIAKKHADEISYAWDDYIISFTSHMLEGTSISRDGFDYEFQDSEECVRLMALERRFTRRILGRAIAVALQRASPEVCYRRTVIKGPAEKENETGYFIQAWSLPAVLRRGGRVCSLQDASCPDRARSGVGILGAQSSHRSNHWGFV